MRKYAWLLTIFSWILLILIVFYRYYEGQLSSDIKINDKNLKAPVPPPKPKPEPVAITFPLKLDLVKKTEPKKQPKLKTKSITPPIPPKQAPQQGEPLHKFQSRDVSYYKAGPNGISWQEFVKLPSQEPEVTNPWPTEELLQGLSVCSKDMENKLKDRLPADHLKWCQWALSPSGGKVKVGKSYGSLGSKDRDKYEQYNCNAVAKGENPSCDDAWGDNQMVTWRKNIMPEMCANDHRQCTSKITCRESPNLAKFCQFDNLLLDFNKLHNVKRPGRSDTRAWDRGFLSTHCDQAAYNDIGYYKVYGPFVDAKATRCDYVINQTVVIYGHDDPHNLGHTLSDYMNVLSMLWLSGYASSSQSLLFLNLDALREGHNYYDEMKELKLPYEKIFGGSVLKAHDFYSLASSSEASKGNKVNVCIKRLLVQPQPVILYTWDGWWQDMRCSFVGPSSLYQRYNLQMRYFYGFLDNFLQQNKYIISKQYWLPNSTHVADSSIADSSSSTEGDDDKFNVLLINRRGGGSPMYTSRIMSNLQEVKQAIESHPILSKRIHLVIKDLATLTFIQQMSLMYEQTDIVIGIHGAGIPNAMHMSVGGHMLASKDKDMKGSKKRNKCCGVIEIFPQGQFLPIRGYGNMARRMGHYYTRMELPGGDSSTNGARVSPEKLVELLQEMIGKIDERPSCLLESVIKDPFFDESVPRVIKK